MDKLDFAMMYSWQEIIGMICFSSILTLVLFAWL
jgi:hypothetical protein